MTMYVNIHKHTYIHSYVHVNHRNLREKRSKEEYFVRRSNTLNSECRILSENVISLIGLLLKYHYQLYPNKTTYLIIFTKRKASLNFKSYLLS